MRSKCLAPLTLLAVAAIRVPVHCSAFESIKKKDCIVALDGSCVDSIDFTGSTNDFTVSPNDDLLAFNTLHTDPMDEPLIFSDPYAIDFGTSLGTDDFGEPYSIFSGYDDLGGFQLASGDRLACDCPGDIQSTKVRKYVALCLSDKMCRWLTLHQGCVWADPSGDVSKSTIKHKY